MSEVLTASRNRPSDARLFGLVDAAARPERIHGLLKDSGAAFRSLYAGLPEEEAGPASLYIVRIKDRKADWAEALSQVDLHTPCLSLIWSRVDLDSLVTHLQAFLFADIGDNMTAMVRYFDPRNIEAVLGAWGKEVSGMFMSPIEQWLYRGRYPDWQRIRNESHADSRICRSIVTRLEETEIDALMAHTEPDELLATLVESGVVDCERPYVERFADFIPRYRQAVQWGISEPADRLIFCQYSYLYGEAFDQHFFINDLLVLAKHTGESFREAVLRVPAGAWAQIEHARKHQLAVS
ncbi:MULTISPECIES: DUF4123 domain-containing protein [unclassified Caballeronia]|uniref:DUF4123 domain-containing protein n=1 Tax=unclassified Caballeronia TaxID=2646786 RepID=UPI001F32BA83|nr:MULTISPECIES: DUF4123 domain-containing protein [unclassified Caballeronia]MCE4547179.1 DUF4123 domain-containing protein [Caballeronia sp. PC1]MCE4572347.1 DUF4123 domain-containing protein [Caballeronia sp. CLC5]